MPLTDIIKDPVTGKQYARDPSVAGSTYEPYVPGAAPATPPAPPTPTGLNALPGSAPTTSGSLGNLRMALRMAAEEAGKSRVADRLGQFQGAGLGKTPGTLGAIADIVRGSVQPDVKSIFSDTMTGIKEANDAKQKELDRINELRATYGSLIPSNVTDLKTALDLVAPTIDKKRKFEFDKMSKDLQDSQASDNDVETWAQGLADGTYKPGNVPAGIRTAAVVRAAVISKDLEGKAKEEYKSRIAFRLEKKTSDFETERTLAMQDDNLTVAEQRQIIDYIDSLEQAQKAAKSSGGGGFFSFLNPGGAQDQPAASVFGTGNYGKISIDDRVAQLKKTLGTAATTSYLEGELLKEGYNPAEIKKRTRTNLIDKIFQ